MRGWKGVRTEIFTIFEIVSGRRSNGTREVLSHDLPDIRLRNLASRLGRWARKRHEHEQKELEGKFLLPSTDSYPVRVLTPQATVAHNFDPNRYAAQRNYWELIEERLFVKALELRQMMMSEFASDKNCPDDPLSLKIKLWALFELNQLERAVDQFESRHDLRTRETIEMAAMCHQLLGNISQARDMREKVRMFGDEEALASSQRIWIHGPQTQLERQNLDFESDVLVEFNPLESLPLGSSQIHVGYYSGSEVSTFQERIQGKIPTLDVAKVMSASDGRTLQRAGLAKPIWLMHSAEAVIPRVWGKAQGLQRAIYDLMWSYPKKINITGVDFFVDASKPWRSGYQRVDVTPAQMTNSLLVHDPFTNYLFVRILFLRGLVCSPVKVLEDGTHAYAEKLSSAMGKV